MTKSWQLSAFVLALILATAVGDTCVYKGCSCSYNGISCSGHGLTTIPPLVQIPNSSYVELDLGSNKITRIPAGSLPPNLITVYLIDNPLTAIDDSAFDDSATTLNTLSLSTVAFSKLPDAFLHLKSLNSLSISDSNISDWNVDAMKNLGQTLAIFEGSNCGFTSWPEWFQYLYHLSQLTLSFNNINSIPDNALDNLTNSLASLSLDNNKLTSIPMALSKLTVLKELNLQYNRISDVRWLPQTAKLMSLALNNNMISDTDQLSKAVAPHADSLYDLDIESNHLSAVPNFTFLTRVQNLDFSNNRISNAISGTLNPNLSTLRLEYNALPLIPTILASVKSVTDMFLTSNMITYIEATDFPSWITGVYLEYNLLTEIIDISFPENSNIQVLYLNNNPISVIYNNVFKNLPRLVRLEMQSTKLTRLPLGLLAASSLAYIDFTGNTNLVCTCEEKSLQPWIMKLYPDSVLGDCGLASIYYFFNFLSQACSK